MSALITDVAHHRPKQFGSWEGLDNKRTLWRGLERLGARSSARAGCERRRRFLAWCAKQCTWFTEVSVDPKTVGLVGEVYWDIVAMAAIYGLDLEVATARLEKVLANDP